MRYYQCKCGHRRTLTNYGPAACTKCEQCGSDLAESPSVHREPIPHDFSCETKRNGKLITVCLHCRNTAEELGLPS